MRHQSHQFPLPNLQIRTYAHPFFSSDSCAPPPAPHHSHRPKPHSCFSGHPPLCPTGPSSINHNFSHPLLPFPPLTVTRLKTFSHKIIKEKGKRNEKICPGSPKNHHVFLFLLTFSNVKILSNVYERYKE